MTCRLVYPTLSVDEVMSYIQSAHDERVDSWDKWESPETKKQCQFARSMVDTVRRQIEAKMDDPRPGGAAAVPVAAAVNEAATQQVRRWCEPALLGRPVETTAAAAQLGEARGVGPGGAEDGEEELEPAPE